MSADPASATALPDAGSLHWRRNLVVCLIGSITTIIAMTLLLPFLPVYVEQLGVHDPAAVVQWSGVAFSATFLSAALVAPLWGRLADRYGRKLMLLRASLGMAIVMSLMGMAQTVWQLVALRLAVGVLGGYASGSVTLVASETPKERSAWAIGVLMSGIMAGNLIGPLIGGALPTLIGIRQTFLMVGGVIFLTFIATLWLIREEKPTPAQARSSSSAWSTMQARGPFFAMLVTGMMLMFANLSVEPIITVYVGQMVEDQSTTTWYSGLALAATALGSILSASRLGKLADRVGYWEVIVGALAFCALLLIPQAYVTQTWQLVVLRFVMGLALGGLMPCIAALIRHSVPASATGNALGLSTSSQYIGQVLGPLTGGFIGAHFGVRSVFLATSAVMALAAWYCWRSRTPVSGAGQTSANPAKSS